jgi:multiple sugar transport system permease protein
LLRNHKSETIVAMILIAPFIAIYGLIFIYPTVDMFLLSFQKAPLIGDGKWVGVDN